MSKIEETFALQVRALGYKKPEREYRFCNRKWRFDFAWEAEKIAVECEGGTWNGGRHTSPAGFRNDCYKYNAATLLGWKVFRFTSDMIRSGEAIKILDHFVNANKMV